MGWRSVPIYRFSRPCAFDVSCPSTDPQCSVGEIQAGGLGEGNCESDERYRQRSAEKLISSPAALANRLLQVEAELERSRATAAQVPKPASVERLLPEVADRYRALVERLETSLVEADVETARAELRTLFGSIRVVADEWEVRLEADLRETQAALLRAAGGSANNLVAGGCFEPYSQYVLQIQAVAASIDAAGSA
jgi:hypothetical protein